MSKKYITCMVAIIAALALSNVVSAQVSGTYSLKDMQDYEILKVEKGQTLYSLAKQYHTTVSHLLELNPTIVDNNLKAGSTIKVPRQKNESVSQVHHSQTPVKEEPQYSGIGPQPFLVPVKYRVAKDETLYSIAKKTGNDVEVIKLWNDLNSDIIKPGQDLIVGYGDGTYNRIPNPEGDKLEELTHNTQDVFSDTNEKNKNKNNTTYTKPSSDNKTKPISSVSSNNTKPNEKKTEVVAPTTTTNNATTVTTPKVSASTNTVVIAPETKVEEMNEPVKVTTSVYDQNKSDAKLIYITEKGLCTYTKGSSGNNYFALHPSAPIGAMINVRNMMNNKSIQVKVIGRLPNTPENENILIKLSGSAAQALNAVDDRFLVQLSYMGYETEKPKDKK
jgi:LysM repeat protein